MKQKFIIFNDLHLKDGNIEACKRSINHMIGIASVRGIKSVVFAGDFFDSRSYQRQEVLIAASEIFDAFHRSNIDLHIFPGNHDKTRYNSYSSFLAPFYRFPNVTLYSQPTRIDIEGIGITLIPFFDDEMLTKMLNEAEGNDILISHFELKGSSHLGKASKKESITPKMLKKFKRTYLGHYHNTHKVSKNIIHLPSLFPQNFGEDNLKGFTIVNEDLSYNIVQGEFEPYHTVYVDLSKDSHTDICALIDEHKGEGKHTRFNISGTDTEVSGFDKGIFADSGITVKIQKSDSHIVAEDSDEIEIMEYDRESIYDMFAVYCEGNGLNQKEGKKILDKFFEK